MLIINRDVTIKKSLERKRFISIPTSTFLLSLKKTEEELEMIFLSL